MALHTIIIVSAKGQILYLPRYQARITYDPNVIPPPILPNCIPVVKSRKHSLNVLNRQLGALI